MRDAHSRDELSDFDARVKEVALEVRDKAGRPTHAFDAASDFGAPVPETKAAKLDPCPRAVEIDVALRDRYVVIRDTCARTRVLCGHERDTSATFRGSFLAALRSMTRPLLAPPSRP